MTDDVPIEAQLVRDGLAPELAVIDTKIERTFGDDDFQDIGNSGCVLSSV